MPGITHQSAVEKMSEAVSKFGSDELLEVHDELFPAALAKPEEGREALLARVLGHLGAEREADALVDLWWLVFTGHRDVWYDEEAGLLHYEEEVETVPPE